MVRRWIFPLLLCLLLAGCHSEAAAAPRRLAPTKETENDILRCYPLDGTECRFFSLSDDLLLIRSDPEGSEILKFQGKHLLPDAALSLPNDKCRIRVCGDRVVCYDPVGQEVRIFSDALKPLFRFSIPDAVFGTPLLCAEGNHLYFCTASDLMVLDCNASVCKTLRQGITRGTEVVALAEESAALICRSGSRALYFSAMDGRQLDTSPAVTAAARIGSRECLCLQCGSNDCLYLGQTMLPLPPGLHFLAFHPGANAALLYREASNALFLCDLTTGNRIACTALRQPSLPDAACITDDGRVFFLQHSGGEAFLYQWLPVSEPQRDMEIRIIKSQDPNQTGLAQCRQRAAFLEQQYGFRILLGQEAAALLPPNCEAETEHLAPILSDVLDRLEQALLPLPSELVRATMRASGTTYVCILRSLRLDPAAEGHLQFWNGNDSYLLLTATDRIGDAFLRCLSPMIDAMILTRSNAYDLWDSLNPPDFRYGGESDSGFADLGCCRSKTDDRAGLLIAAMADGNRERFCDAVLQKKLVQMCLGIRAAYPFLQSRTDLPWEQYLWNPI